MNQSPDFVVRIVRSEDQNIANIKILEKITEFITKNPSLAISGGFTISPKVGDCSIFLSCIDFLSLFEDLPCSIKIENTYTKISVEQNGIKFWTKIRKDLKQSIVTKELFQQHNQNRG